MKFCGMLKVILVTMVMATQLLHQASGHGRLMDPPGRASAWRLGFRTPVNYDDNAINCGGFARQQYNGGKCGVCGDPWDGKREYEAGGKFATGTIMKTYKMGQVINVKIEMTFNHDGWFEFRICPNNNVSRPVTHECLNKHVLPRADGNGARFQVTPGKTGMYTIPLQLPAGMICAQCVLQWKYHAGNSWGVDPATGKGCMGCGPQTEFYGCSDIAILADGTCGCFSPTVTSAPPTGQSTQTTRLVTSSPVPPSQTTATPGTKAPTTTRTTSKGQQLTCHGIGNWANNPDLDRWCTDSCNQGNCPTIACNCSDTGAVTLASTAGAQSTAAASTTTSATTTTTTTTKTTTKTTTPAPTATTTKPASTSTTPNQKTQTPVVAQKLTCHGIGNWANNPDLDRWCTDSCNDGNCPSLACDCGDTGAVTQSQTTINVPTRLLSLTTSTATTKEASSPPSSSTTRTTTTTRTTPTPPTSSTQVPMATNSVKISTSATPVQANITCKAIGLWAGNPYMDKFCTGACATGSCPKDDCSCSQVSSAVPTSATTSPPAVQGKKTCTAKGPWLGVDVFDTWCTQECNTGNCPDDVCSCTVVPLGIPETTDNSKTTSSGKK